LIEIYAYLLDTSVLSARYDPSHLKYLNVKEFLDRLSPHDLAFVSSVAIAEIQYGAALYEMAEGHASSVAMDVLYESISNYQIREINKFTAKEYGYIKAKVAFKYLSDPMNRNIRSKWIEDWIDKYTARPLNINEGDLWMCAQAKERNLILLTTDKRMERISDADPDVQIRVIE
jgi:predicted nucleic acid-binding protein